jgi:uncharacterized cupin superfamily protein
MAMNDRGWAVADVHEIPPIAADWGDTWKSVRHHFGITAFGVNAVSKGEGEVLIPEHDESESGQQELFFVHEGEATATLDGERTQVPAGSFVAVGPQVRRTFSAATTPTTLIVVGSPVGQAFEIAPWEKA